MRSEFYRAIATLIMLVSPLGASAADSPSASETTAFSQGQAYQRLFEDTVMPGTCGIVLERPQCNADFRAIQAMRGPDPTDAAMTAWLATGALADAVKDWNGTYVPDTAWTAHPDFAWWYSAGLVSIAAALPQNEGTTEYLAHFQDVMVAHDGLAPAEYRGLILTSGTPFARLQPLQVALLRTIPPAPYPDPALHLGVKGDVQLGIYASTLQELLDNPLALSRPESRAFGLAVVRQLQAINDSYATGVSLAVVAKPLSGDIPDSPGINAMRDALSRAVSTKWPLARRQAYVLGAFTAQIAYNAAVLQDPAADAMFRGAGATLGYDGMSAIVAADREALKRIPYAREGGDWKAINAAASRAVVDMIATP